MKPKDKIEKLVESLQDTTSTELDQRILNSLAQTMDDSQDVSAPLKPNIWRTIMKNRITKLATAAVIVIAVLIIINQFSDSIDGVSSAFAAMEEAVERMPVMHKVYSTNYGEGQEHHSEIWYDFISRTVIGKYSKDGNVYKISSLNYDTMKNMVYVPESNTVEIVYRCDVSPRGYPDSAAEVVNDYIKRFEYRGAKIVRQRDVYGDEDVDVFQLTIESNERKNKEWAKLVVNRESHLPMAYENRRVTPKGDIASEQKMSFDFLTDMPTDIYDVGVPRTTKVVQDLESEKRLERKRKLLEDKAVYEERFKEIYRLKEDEVIRYIPPLLAEPRIKIDQMGRLVEQLERESSPIMPPLSSDEIKRMNEESHYSMFSWNGEKAEGGEIFTGTDGVSLGTAFERIIVLSKFQYNSIPDTLLSIRIPGDWVVREGASKEQLLKAFEQVVQEHTNQPIRFEKQQVEVDAIVVRGKFRFKHLTGTYNNRRLHVYSDKLDPDERGGGGSGSLDRFLTQRLAETQLKQHVLNLTDSSDDVRAKWRCHMSSYLGKIAPGPERDAKLDLLLENLSRQTSLVFTKERRIVDVWHVVEDDRN